MDLLNQVAASGVLVLIVGWFFYRTYQVIRNEKRPSPWIRVQAQVLSSRITNQSFKNDDELEVELSYTANGVEHHGTGYTTLRRGEQPPTSIELVYTLEKPDAWEFGEDHDYEEGTGVPSDTRAMIIWIWVILLLIGGSILIGMRLMKN